MLTLSLAVYPSNSILTDLISKQIFINDQHMD